MTRETQIGYETGYNFFVYAAGSRFRPVRSLRRVRGAPESHPISLESMNKWNMTVGSVSGTLKAAGPGNPARTRMSMIAAAGRGFCHGSHPITGKP